MAYSLSTVQALVYLLCKYYTVPFAKEVQCYNSTYIMEIDIDGFYSVMLPMKFEHVVIWPSL